MKLTCFYYSATGNTRRAVELTKKRLEAAGSSMEMVKISKRAPAPDVRGCDAIIVAFPVFSFSPPVFVKRFIRALPRGNGMPAHVLAVDGGGGGSAAAMAVRLLERRGYSIVSSGRASYPDNWVQAWQPPGEAEAAMRTMQGDAAAALFADSLVAGTAGGRAVDRRIDAASAVMAFLFGSIGRRFLGKVYYADEDCDGCGICAARCPARAILLHEGKRARPFWTLGCEDCNACINRCPKKAINTSIGRFIVMVSFITVCIVLGIKAYHTFVTPVFASALPPVLARAANALSILAIVLLSHFLFAPFDRYILRFIQRIPGVRRFFAWTFTKSWRRYTAKAIQD